MPLAYLILLIIAFVSARLHWPLTNLAVLAGTLVMCADLLVQLIRMLMKRIHISTLFGSIVLSVLSIGYAFTWLFWPGAFETAVFALLLSLVYVIYWLASKRKPTTRFVVILLVTMVLGVYTTMKPSSFFCMKNGFDPVQPHAPLTARHFLAWLYNQEGNYGASMQMLLDEKKYAEDKISKAEVERASSYYVDDLRNDLKTIDQAIVELNGKHWNNYVRLWSHY